MTPFGSSLLHGFDFGIHDVCTIAGMFISWTDVRNVFRRLSILMGNAGYEYCPGPGLQRQMAAQGSLWLIVSRLEAEFWQADVVLNGQQARNKYDQPGNDCRQRYILAKI